MIVLTLFFDKSGENQKITLLYYYLWFWEHFLFSFLLDFIFKTLRSDVSENKKIYSDY